VARQRIANTIRPQQPLEIKGFFVFLHPQKPLPTAAIGCSTGVVTDKHVSAKANSFGLVFFAESTTGFASLASSVSRQWQPVLVAAISRGDNLWYLVGTKSGVSVYPTADLTLAFQLSAT